MGTNASKIRRDAKAAAIEYGHFELSGPGSRLIAPPGKFQGEPYYVMYFWDAMLDGDGEPIYDDGREVYSLTEVTDDEREAFELDKSTVAIALWHSDQGFVTLEELNEERYVYLLNPNDQTILSSDVEA